MHGPMVDEPVTLWTLLRAYNTQNSLPQRRSFPECNFHYLKFTSHKLSLAVDFDFFAVPAAFRGSCGLANSIPTICFELAIYSKDKQQNVSLHTQFLNRIFAQN